MAFKMKGHSLPGINQRVASPMKATDKEEEVVGKTKDGGTTVGGKLTAAKDALLSPNFIKNYNSNKKDIREGNYEGYKKKEKKKSPAKCPLIAMAPAIMGAMGSMKKKE